MVVPRGPLRYARGVRARRRRSSRREESPSGKRRRLRAARGRPDLDSHFPYREEPLRYDGSETPRAADVRTYRWHPGESIELGFSVHGDGRAALRELRQPNGDPAWVCIEEAAELAAYGLHRWHYRTDPPRLIETAAFDRDSSARRPRPDACLMGERRPVRLRTPPPRAPRRRRRRTSSAAEAVIDAVAGNLTLRAARSGHSGRRTRGWTTGWHPDHTRLHARTLADATLFMLARHSGRRAECRPPCAPISTSCCARSATTARCRLPTMSTPARPSPGKAAPAWPGSRRSLKPVSSKRPGVQARTSQRSTTGTAHLRMSTSRRPRRTATRL